MLCHSCYLLLISYGLLKHYEAEILYLTSVTVFGKVKKSLFVPALPDPAASRTILSQYSKLLNSAWGALLDKG